MADTISYTVKTIVFMKRRVPIMMQNQNGPCPLLALANVMLLRNQIKLSPDAPSVTQERLIALIADFLLDTNSGDRLDSMNEEYRANTQQNVADAIAQLPKLATGIDVNVSFCDIRGFEFTQETVIFDLLDVRLLHGWLVDPKDDHVADSIGKHSYNELVSLIVDRLGDDAEFQGKAGATDDAAASSSTANPTDTAETGSGGTGRGPFQQDEALEAKRLQNDAEHASTKQLDTLAEAVQARSQLQQRFGQASILELKSLHSLVKDLHLDKEEKSDLEQAIALSLIDSSSGACLSQAPPASPPPTSFSLRTHDEMLPTVGTCSTHPEQLLETGSGEDTALPKIEAQLPEEQVLQKLPHLLATSVSSNHHEETELQQRSSTAGSPDKEGQAACIAGEEDKAQTNSEVEASSSNSGASSASGLTATPQQAEHLPLPKYNADAIAKGKMPAYRTPVLLQQSQSSEQEAGLAGGHDILRASDGKESARKAEELHQAMLVQAFLYKTSSQMTQHGLHCLQQGMRPNELGILFRNNHFNVIFAYNSAIWILATDQGYLFEEVVWERLSDVHGNNEFARADFMLLSNKGHVHAGFAQGEKPSEDADLALALQMQEEENKRQTDFLSQQSSQQLSYSQAAARPAQDKPTSNPDLHSPRSSPKRKPPARGGNGQAPGSKNDSWKFWKWKA